MVLFLFKNVIYIFLLLWLCILIVCFCMGTLTAVFPCFFPSSKPNARVKPSKTGHGPHPSKIFVLFYVLFVLCRSVCCLCVYMCTVLLPPGVNPIAVNKNIYRIIYHTEENISKEQRLALLRSRKPEVIRNYIQKRSSLSQLVGQRLYWDS